MQIFYSIGRYILLSDTRMTDKIYIAYIGNGFVFENRTPFADIFL